jgi:outer membrane protein assembly factor BamB
MKQTEKPRAGGANGSAAIVRAAAAIGLVIGLIVAGALSSCSTSPNARKQALAEKWQFATPGVITAALALGSDGTVYAASHDGFVYALDGSGHLLWKFEAGPMTAAPAIGADGTIYVVNQEERIFAISPSGTQVWAQGGGPFADKQNAWTGAALDQNHLYVPWRGSMRAIGLSSSAFDFSAGIGFENDGSASILPNGLLVYPGVGRIDAVDSTGRTEWQYPVMNPPLSVDMITKGRIPQGDFWLDSGIAVGLDGTIYACATGSRLVALSPDGTYKWEFKTKTHSSNRASPVIAADGTIYFASGDGSVYALNLDGTQKWAVDTGGPIVATPMVAVDGTVYVLNGTAFMAVSPEGKIVTTTAFSGGAEASPTLGPDGTIYAASRLGKIVALAGTHGPLMTTSSWPKFQADLANSGRARSF